MPLPAGKLDPNGPAIGDSGIRSPRLLPGFRRARQLNLSADEVLTTTRAVRKRLDFDRPVDMADLRECLDIALQAPTGSNAQGWHFLFVTDEAKKARIAELYAQRFTAYRQMDVSAHQLAEGMDLVDAPVRTDITLPPDVASKLTHGDELISQLNFFDQKEMAAVEEEWIGRWNAIFSE